MARAPRRGFPGTALPDAQADRIRMQGFPTSHARMLQPVPSPEDPHIDPTAPSARLRLVSCKLARTSGGMSSVTAEFNVPEVPDVLKFRMDATASPAGDLRLAALVTLDAVCSATGRAFTAELIGVKPVRAFDTTFVVVAMIARVDGVSQRLVGAAIADDDQATSVAVATLQAVNRVVSPLLARRTQEN